MTKTIKRRAGTTVKAATRKRPVPGQRNDHWVLSSNQRRTAERRVSLDFSPRDWKGGAKQAAEKLVAIPSPGRSPFNSRGQRPRKASRTVLDPEGVAHRPAGGRKTGGTSQKFDPFRVELGWRVHLPGALTPAT